MARANSESIAHCAAIRANITGSGNLKFTLIGYNDIHSQLLNDKALETATNKQLTALANFKDQRMQIEFRTTEADEYFTIDKIIPFVKVVACGYPQ